MQPSTIPPAHTSDAGITGSAFTTMVRVKTETGVTVVDSSYQETGTQTDLDAATSCTAIGNGRAHTPGIGCTCPVGEKVRAGGTDMSRTRRDFRSPPGFRFASGNRWQPPHRHSADDIHHSSSSGCCWSVGWVRVRCRKQHRLQPDPVQRRYRRRGRQHTREPGLHGGCAEGGPCAGRPFSLTLPTARSLRKATDRISMQPELNCESGGRRVSGMAHY